MIFLEAAIDLESGSISTLSGGGLGAVISEPAPGAIASTILVNRMGTEEATLDTLVPLLMGAALPQLAGSIGTFPLPSFLALDLELVDVDRNGDFLSLFLDFSPI